MVKKFLITFLILILGSVSGFFAYQNRAHIKSFLKTHALSTKAISAHIKMFKKIVIKEDKQTFTFWTIQLKAPAGDFINENISAFRLKHPNIDVVWVDIPIAEAQKRTLASILGGNPPDLINLNPDFSSLLAQKGVLEFFNDDELVRFHPELTDKLKFSGRAFAIPFYATSSVTLYNKKVVDKCLADVEIKTYNDLSKAAPKLMKCQNVPVYALNLNENDTFARILNKYDIYDFNDALSIKNAESVYSLFKNMYINGYMPKDTLTINHREVAEKFMSNNALYVVVGSNFIKMVKENAPSIYEDSDITAQLTGPSGKFDVGLMNLIIPKSAKNKELAKEFAFMLTSPENQLRLAELTNVLPANLEVLSNEYFTNCSDELYEKARCVSAKQLNSLVKKDFGYKNKKAINDILNKSVEEVLLTGANLGATLKQAAFQVRVLQKD